MPELESHRHAAELLKKWDRRPLTVVQVNTDSILFTDALGKPRTAWLYLAGGETKFCVEPGFPAWPSMPLPQPEVAPEVAASPTPFHERYQPPGLDDADLPDGA